MPNPTPDSRDPRIDPKIGDIVEFVKRPDLIAYRREVINVDHLYVTYKMLDRGAVRSLLGRWRQWTKKTTVIHAAE